MVLKAVKTILFSVLFFHYSNLYAQNADIDLLKQINIGRNKSFDNTFKFISNTTNPISIAAPLSVLITGFAKKDEALKQKGYVSCASALLAVGLSTSLKYTIKRKRPFVSYPEIENVISETDPSLPSGHTTMAFATATVISLNFPEWYVIVPSYIYAGAVAYSRLHLGVHYPTDVLAGIIVGAGSSYVCYKAQKWIGK